MNEMGESGVVGPFPRFVPNPILSILFIPSPTSTATILLHIHSRPPEEGAPNSAVDAPRHGDPGLRRPGSCCPR